MGRESARGRGRVGQFRSSRFCPSWLFGLVANFFGAWDDWSLGSSSLEIFSLNPKP